MIGGEKANTEVLGAQAVLGRFGRESRGSEEIPATGPRRKL
jgi:hypothetical protein